MANFLKIFFGCLLALFVFTMLGFFFLTGLAGGLMAKEEKIILSSSVLMLDFNHHFSELKRPTLLGDLGNEEENIPNLYNLLRLIKAAKVDPNISGIYIKCNQNANGFATTEEIRNALLDFKKGNKFIVSYSDVMPQKLYALANVSDKIFINPAGLFEWNGFHAQFLFYKNALNKLEIEPQIFYCGKYKSATEPFRVDKMSPENRLQTTLWLKDIYNQFIKNTSDARNIDTTILTNLATSGMATTPQDALKHKLIDSIKYEDEALQSIKSIQKLAATKEINFITIQQYYSSKPALSLSGDKIALIIAQGSIVDGVGDNETIGSDTYKKMIRKAKNNKQVKAIVLRVNSGGGSALASENIWRELALAKKVKPVVVSFGDVAASGGYYIACAADSIFCSTNTITGSIGVFGIIPNFENFLKNKLGITSDVVETSPLADEGTPLRPLSGVAKKMIQAEIDRVYGTFKQRVANARKMDTARTETIAQGRVWAGATAKKINLVDKIGGINDAIKAAAKLAKLDDYFVQEYPEPQSFFEQIVTKKQPLISSQIIKSELGNDHFRIFKALKNLKDMTNRVQTRILFEVMID